MIGIYSITNTVNGKKYIGQSRNIAQRWQHERRLHSINPHLKSAFIKYGLAQFTFEVLCECEVSELSELEVFIISELGTFHPHRGYNKTFGGEGGVLTLESRQKISNTLKGNRNSCAKAGKNYRVKTLSEEHKARIAASLRGRKTSEETREKFRQRRASEATKLKMSLSAKARHARAKN